jgi:integrase
VGDLLLAMDGHGGRYETNLAFRLMWWTLVRPSEAVEAEWAEFDLDAALWTIPPGRMKMGRKHLVPLPTQAVLALRAMHALSGKHVHVFPGRDNKKAPMNSASFRQALLGLGWSGRYSPHATRVTGSTRLNELGYPSDWIERQLAHVEANSVRRTYNHADYLSDRTKMMQDWADLLDKWMAAGKAKGVAQR